MCGISAITNSCELLLTVLLLNSQLITGMLESPGMPLTVVLSELLLQSAQQVDFAVLHADIVNHFLLGDHRL